MCFSCSHLLGKLTKKIVIVNDMKALTMKLTKPWTQEIFMECYCVTRRKPMRHDKTANSKDNIISFWFCGLLACPELNCDWSQQNQFSWKCSGVHMQFSEFNSKYCNCCKMLFEIITRFYFVWTAAKLSQQNRMMSYLILTLTVVKLYFMMYVDGASDFECHKNSVRVWLPFLPTLFSCPFLFLILWQIPPALS